MLGLSQEVRTDIRTHVNLINMNALLNANLTVSQADMVEMLKKCEAILERHLYK